MQINPVKLRNQMQINPIKLQNQNKLIEDYRNGVQSAINFFDYAPFKSFEQRVKDLKKRTFDRVALHNVLTQANKAWDATEATFKNIDRLKDEKTVVVIGGQQAGLLTGPMYTVNKLISIIQSAKEQERILNIPVIPVFWIAGEDHDFEEINHIHLSQDQAMKKHKITQEIQDKKSASHIELDQKKAAEWLETLFGDLSETMYTKDLYTDMKQCLEKSTTYVDFFARVIFKLFKETGVVLIDSADPSLRALESAYFTKMIEKQPEISKAVYMQREKFRQAGYPITVDVAQNDANLFYQYNGERILLTRTETGNWAGKQDEVELTTAEIRQIAKTEPGLLSNNVVTRPLMQELVFPTLAFIAGGGEISYWAILKPAFEILELKMPPILPRLSFTYIEPRINKTLDILASSAEDVINFGISKQKMHWLGSLYNPSIDRMVEELKRVVDDAHAPLRAVASQIRTDIGQLADKNQFHLHKEIDFLKKKMTFAIEAEHAQQVKAFDLVETALRPHGRLQERVWNPLQFLNVYGTEFIQNLLQENCSFEESHYLVQL